jgi:hypothetical protein
MDILWHIIYVIGMYRIVFLGAVFLVPAIVALVIPKMKKYISPYYSIFIILALLNIFFGIDLAVGVVHMAGEEGKATISNSYNTGTRYNGHNVIGYNVLIKTAEGGVVETGFQDDDFNIYPPKNRVVYPGINNKFNVYYLRWFPKDFIIIDNDDSSWAVSLRCADLKRNLRQASAKYDFDRNNEVYRSDYIATITKLLGDKCVSDQSEIDVYRRDMEMIEAGKSLSEGAE